MVEGLVELYEALGGAHWLNSTNWLQGEPCVDRWFGVDCCPDTHPVLSDSACIDGSGLTSGLYYLLPTTCCLVVVLPTAYCQLPTAYCLLPTTYYLPPTAYYLLPSTHCLLPTTFYRLLSAFYLLPSAYCLLFTA